MMTVVVLREDLYNADNFLKPHPHVKSEPILDWSS